MLDGITVFCFHHVCFVTHFYLGRCNQLSICRREAETLFLNTLTCEDMSQWKADIK